MLMRLTGVRPKELRDLYRALERSGVDIEQTQNSHIRMTGPDGSVEYGPLTSSDPNVHRIVARRARARGWAA